ncbi:MAG: response regulator [Gammaproteobacteria bacterium]|nr:response regulator [Gammaproteobacteria bacterium]
MKKILVVDDSRTSRAIFKASLPEEVNYEVIEAGDVESALKQAADTKPDLCVMDYNLPDMYGTEIAEKIMASGVSAPFILMTANMQESVKERAKKLGFVAFIEKPINTDKITDALKTVGWL